MIWCNHLRDEEYPKSNEAMPDSSAEPGERGAEASLEIWSTCCALFGLPAKRMNEAPAVTILMA
jgi:hypothetical protein